MNNFERHKPYYVIVNIHTPGYLMPPEKFTEDFKRVHNAAERNHVLSTNAVYEHILKGSQVHREGARKFELVFENLEDARNFAREVHPSYDREAVHTREKGWREIYAD